MGRRQGRVRGVNIDGWDVKERSEKGWEIKFHEIGRGWEDLDVTRIFLFFCPFLGVNVKAGLDLWVLPFTRDVSNRPRNRSLRFQMFFVLSLFPNSCTSSNFKASLTLTNLAG